MVNGKEPVNDQESPLKPQEDFVIEHLTLGPEERAMSGFDRTTKRKAEDYDFGDEEDEFSVARKFKRSRKSFAGDD